MDSYNLNFYRMIRSVDPEGILTIPNQTFINEHFLKRYFDKSEDYEKVDVVTVCGKLIILLNNFEDITMSPRRLPRFVQNNFQEKKYPFLMIAETFFGLIIFYKNSIEAFFKLCQKSIMFLFQSKVMIDKPKRIKKTQPKKQKISRKNEEEQIITTNNEDQFQNDINRRHSAIPRIFQERDLTLNAIGENAATQMKNIDSQTETVNLNHNQENSAIIPIENLNVQPEIVNLNQNQFMLETLEENTQIPMECIKTQPEIINLSQNQLIQTDIEENANKMPIEYINAQPETINLNYNQVNELEEAEVQQLHEHNECSQVVKKKKRKNIYNNENLNLKRLKKMKICLPKRPFQYIATRYNQSISHFPLRYFELNKMLHIGFSAVTIQKELDEIEISNGIFSRYMTKNEYNAIVEKCNNLKHPGHNSIFKQSLNNELPHLNLIPLAEECLTNNSLVWRSTVNEMNKKLSDSVKDISALIKIGNDWDEFEAETKRRINQSLLPKKSSIIPRLSNIDISQPILPFNSPPNIIFLNENPSMINFPQHNSTAFPEVMSNYVDQLPSNDSLIKNKRDTEYEPRNIICSDEFKLQDNVSHIPLNSSGEKSIEVFENIVEMINQSSSQENELKFTQLCPTRITSRKKACKIFSTLLRLHKEKKISITQTSGSMDPTLIKLEINTHFNNF
ncbi:uncharacterized protein LOC126899124 isoform X2 [Daktulosphaira vitifoliae]|uniref:uncharacterized protein LOC126899124 isoform X2 n=1 Tax=Daktulosphaira vitifoliae TaxID=58002 RepID=UPI0021A9ECA2|nr:uncharacterized protein LOC126899124 isoform X2 [Daktulosphaira vitifoliae]